VQVERGEFCNTWIHVCNKSVLRLLWKTKRPMSGWKSLPLPSLFPFETSKYMFFQRLIIPQGAQMVTSMYCLVCTHCFCLMPTLLMLQEPVLVICQLEGTL
jgi:hypothetical protein